MQVLVVILAAITIFVIYFCYRGAMLVIKVPRMEITSHPYTFGKKYESFEAITIDGLKIKGWFVPASSDKAIILFHGWGANKSDILPATIFLSEKFNLVYFDFRNHGESSDGFNSFGVYELRDAQAVYKWLKENHPEISEVYTWGLSMGGAVSIVFCSLNDIKKAVVESAYYSFNETLKRYIREFYKLQTFPFYYIIKFFIKLKLGFDPEEFSPRNTKPTNTKYLFL
ncbi:MAG: alpha/beta hydrolase, partial [bacterium]|nr:alpha/beta hydrolase [bacterium]